MSLGCTHSLMWRLAMAWAAWWWTTSLRSAPTPSTHPGAPDSVPAKLCVRLGQVGQRRSQFGKALHKAPVEVAEAQEAPHFPH